MYTSLEALSTSSWYPNSGATHHIRPEVTNLQQIFSYHGSDQLYIVNTQGLTILSFSDSHIFVNCEILKLQNILNVPHIKKNLLSIQKLTCGNDVIF